ncbi:MinD/ParA family protein [Paeniglutamicibacter sp. NPDC012692]|uniref:MinD/ParA family ATP-binding protein n=1 Tax=Paeniglutamicibacter sp. NPDC012692 TaxID=3364388 RepID=UPI0036B9F524
MQDSAKPGAVKPVASSPSTAAPSTAAPATPVASSMAERTAAKTSTPEVADGKGSNAADKQTKQVQVSADQAPVETIAAPVNTAAAQAAAQAAAPVNTAAAQAADAVEAAGSPRLDDLSTADGRRQAFRDMTPGEGERDTFLRPEDETSFRAERGFRGFLSRMGFNMEPSAQEVEERNWRRTVGTRLNEPKTISVVNGKGGANKTPTAVLLSAVFGRNSGDPVLVWDNNGTRGTLGWRTVQGQHSWHSMDLLAASAELKDVKVGDPIIHEYVHYQPEDCYSVLRTDPTLLASEQHVNAEDFDVMHEIVSRFFSLTIVDSGNDESAERWMRMIDHTDQLVIASTTVEEHAEAGALLLEALAKRGGHYAELAKNAVVIVSQHQPQGNSDQLNRIAHGFRRLARSVVTVPYDAALVKGQIRFDGLRPATRRAWLHATAAVATALHN